MKRLTVLFLALAIAPHFFHSGVSGAEIAPIYLTPRPNSTLVPAETAISFRFREDVEASSLEDTAVLVSGSISGEHAGTTILARDGKTVIFKPNEPFAPLESVSVSVDPGLLSMAGNRLQVDSYRFTVSAGKPGKLSPAANLLAEDVVGLNRINKLPPFAAGSTSSSTALPANFPEITVTVPADGVGEGYVFLSNFTVDWSDRGVSKSQPFLLILDNEGEPVFFRNMTQGRPALDFKKQPNGLLTYGEWGGIFYAMDSSYNIVKTYQAGNGYPTDIHDLQVLPNEHALLMIYDTQKVDMRAYGGRQNAMVTGLVIQELDIDGQVVFQWRSWDHFAFTESTADLTRATIDLVHGNAVELDHDGNLLISSRALDEITKIDRQSGEIIWRLGGKANEFTFVGDPEPFFAQHDIRRLDNGHVTIFDNRSGPGSAYARAVEYELDEVNKIATLVWEYRNSSMSPAMGNTQRLPNGNTMIGWGSVYPSLTEVKPDGEIALEMSFVPYAEPNLLRNSYRAFRFEWEGAPTSKPQLRAKNEIPGVTSLTVSWNGATNVGSYRLYEGENREELTLIATQERDGFETTFLAADADEELCYFRAMPVDKDGKETRLSNLALAEHCIEGQVFMPLILRR